MWWCTMLHWRVFGVGFPLANLQNSLLSVVEQDAGLPFGLLGKSTGCVVLGKSTGCVPFLFITLRHLPSPKNK